MRRQCCLVKPTTRRDIDGHWNSWPWNRRWFYSSQGLTYVEIYFACFFFGCYGWRRYILAPFSLLVLSSHKKDTSCLQPRGQHTFFRERGATHAKIWLWWMAWGKSGIWLWQYYSCSKSSIFEPSLCLVWSVEPKDTRQPRYSFVGEQ